MFKLFKYITYFLSAKKLYEKPDEVLGEVPIAYIQGFFITSFIIIGLVMAALLGFGFSFDILLLKIFGFVFLAILIVDIIIYTIVVRKIKQLVEKISHRTKDYIKRSTTRT